MTNNPYQPPRHTNTPMSLKNWHAAAMLASLTLAVVGLVLAALSNPKRFSLPVGWNQDAFAAGGCVCLLGSLILLGRTLRATTLQSTNDWNDTIFWDLVSGHAFQMGGGFLLCVTTFRFTVAFIVLVGLRTFVRGAMNYIEDRGYSSALGLIGVAGIIGFTCLYLLPSRSETTNP